MATSLLSTHEDYNEVYSILFSILNCSVADAQVGTPPGAVTTILSPALNPDGTRDLELRVSGVTAVGEQYEGQVKEFVYVANATGGVSFVAKEDGYYFLEILAGQSYWMGGMTIPMGSAYVFKPLAPSWARIRVRKNIGGSTVPGDWFYESYTAISSI